MTCAALIVAAGRGERLRSPGPKALVDIGGTPLLAHVLERFERSGVIDQVVVAGPETEVERCRAIARDRTRLPCQVVPGGARRQDSVRMGLERVVDMTELVAVHDAARPLVSPQLIRRCVERAVETGAATAALPISDSVREIDRDGVVTAAPPRERLWLAQTPQVFRVEILREAHRRALAEGREATDDVALVAAIGVSVHVVAGEASNLKITFPEDLRLAEAWLEIQRRR
jgi:2-C-methyl-D-erythritol 4-phosphate cytidylyltransferase